MVEYIAKGVTWVGRGVGVKRFNLKESRPLGIGHCPFKSRGELGLADLKRCMEEFRIGQMPSSRVQAGQAVARFEEKGLQDFRPFPARR